MTEESVKNQKSGRREPKSADSREERLRDALRANLQRRKAQSRARRTGDGNRGDKPE